MTLAGAKPILEQNLYKAFYDAYMTQYEANGEAQSHSSTMQSNITSAADKFAKELSKQMATAIHDFVKEIGITATVSGTVIAPSGPCTGSLPPTSFTIS